jgi:rhomboid protease GluP
MCARGISFTQPALRNIVEWGGDFTPYTIGRHQYWRLLTSTFVHFGIIHIAFNMYVLYQIGPFIQMAFGRARYLVIYFRAAPQ